MARCWSGGLGDWGEMFRKVWKVELADPLFVETVVLDGMWRVPDGVSAQDGRRYRIAWFDPPFRPRLEEATQALGICLTDDRRIVLVTWDGENWTLPGGRPEPGETLEQGLAREVREEACARVVTSRYIGCQRVEEASAQLILDRGLAIEEELVRRDGKS
ncbi:MAG: NUDIX domain-containing protein [Propionibacteriales bacterium]|nr:NUDIX domain-containing protein [Propionibacteriales bacterium]